MKKNYRALITKRANTPLGKDSQGKPLYRGSEVVYVRDVNDKSANLDLDHLWYVDHADEDGMTIWLTGGPGHAGSELGRGGGSKNSASSEQIILADDAVRPWNREQG